MLHDVCGKKKSAKASFASLTSALRFNRSLVRRFAEKVVYVRNKSDDFPVASFEIDFNVPSSLVCNAARLQEIDYVLQKKKLEKR
jgi:hypothetical protein